MERVSEALTSHMQDSELARKLLENRVLSLEVECDSLILCVRECLLLRQILVRSIGVAEVVEKSRLLDTAWPTGARSG